MFSLKNSVILAVVLLSGCSDGLSRGDRICLDDVPAECKLTFDGCIKTAVGEICLIDVNCPEEIAALAPPVIAIKKEEVKKCGK